MKNSCFAAGIEGDAPQGDNRLYFLASPQILFN